MLVDNNTPPRLLAAFSESVPDTYINSLVVAEYSEFTHAEIVEEAIFGIPASMRDLLKVPYSGCPYILIHISLLADFGLDVLPDAIVDNRVLH